MSPGLAASATPEEDRADAKSPAGSGGVEDVDETLADRAGGASAEIRVVDARSSHLWVETLRRAELAIVGISGAGRTDLDLDVYDEHGNLVERGISFGGDETVSWVPAWTGRHRSVIENLGLVRNQYAIVTN